MRRPLLPRPINLAFIAAGALLVGGRAAIAAAPEPPAQTIVEPGSTVTNYQIVTKKIRGKIVRLPGGEHVVYVPTIYVRVDHKRIRVPAHQLPFRRIGVTSGLTAAVAQPLLPVTVTVYVPTVTTVYVPVTVTETSPPSTETVTIPTTITVPLIPTTSDR